MCFMGWETTMLRGKLILEVNTNLFSHSVRVGRKLYNVKGVYFLAVPSKHNTVLDGGIRVWNYAMNRGICLFNGHYGTYETGVMRANHL